MYLVNPGPSYYHGPPPTQFYLYDPTRKVTDMNYDESPIPPTPSPTQKPASPPTKKPTLLPPLFLT